MTRYARAKGSKASNERVPNDATPWVIMKQQLAENLEKKQAYREKTKSAKELLQENQNLFYHDSTGNVNNDWAEFEEISPKKVKKNVSAPPMEVGKKKQKSKEKKDSVPAEGVKDTKQKGNVSDNKIDKNSISKRKSSCIDVSTNETEIEKQKKRKEKFGNAVNEQNGTGSFDRSITKKRKKMETGSTEKDADNSADLNPEINKSFKKRKLRKQSPEVSIETSTGELRDEDGNNSLNTSYTNEGNRAILSKRQKRNQKNKNKSTNENTVDKIHQTERNNGNDKTNYSAPKFSKNFVNKPNDRNNASNKFGKRKFDAINQNNTRKPPKFRDDKDHKRRKPDTGPIKMTINGIEVEIVKYDGFPVRKADADRLKDLKQQMIMKGIPKKEIDAAMKLERRKAEKALSRLRRCVCFHCRKSGHNLSDCPELGTEQAGTGICFKCGSTEHTHFECKVAKATEYRYATCFICREQGHIAKQCPDNPKGIYPQGGACKICGDVTHLKKDCPDLVKEKEEAAITVDTIANDTVEHLEEDKRAASERSNKSSKKVVKF